MVFSRRGKNCFFSIAKLHGVASFKVKVGFGKTTNDLFF
jgi:hypothetical protein